MYIEYLSSLSITVNVDEHQVSMHIFTFVRHSHLTDYFIDLKQDYAANFPRSNCCYIDSDFVICYRKPSCTEK